MVIPLKYEPKLLTEKEKEGYLNWSLDFFTNQDILQIPYVDITLQLEVTTAYQLYKSNPIKEATFFAFLLWNLAQILPQHPCFNLRLINNQWYKINPFFVIPVAINHKNRFSEMVLENVNKLSYVDFIKEYREKLNNSRKGEGERVNHETYLLSCFVGNLPNLQFTGLTLHYYRSTIIGQPMFYFGKRYEQNNQLYIPFAAKLHHATTDPFMLDLLLKDFKNQLEK